MLHYVDLLIQKLVLKSPLIRILLTQGNLKQSPNVKLMSSTVIIYNTYKLLPDFFRDVSVKPWGDSNTKKYNFI